MRRIAYLLFPMLGLIDASPAMASCANPQNCSCTVSVSGMLFGTYSPQSLSATDTVGTISTTCNSDDPGNSTFSVALSSGNSGSTSQRAMSGASATLLYNIYTNATRSTIWGDDSGGGVSVVAAFPPANGTTQMLSAYGRIPARQSVAPGGYSDVITVTITY